MSHNTLLVFEVTILVLAEPHKGAFAWIVGFLAVVLGSANVVGGFVVTDRMLEMFKKREPAKPKDDESAS